MGLKHPDLAPAHNPSDAHEMGGDGGYGGVRVANGHPACGNGASTLNTNGAAEDEGGRKRRADDIIHEDTENVGIDYAANIEAERRHLPRQPPLGVVRQLCLEAAESRLCMPSEGGFNFYYECVCVCGCSQVRRPAA